MRDDARAQELYRLFRPFIRFHELAPRWRRLRHAEHFARGRAADVYDTIDAATACRHYGILGRRWRDDACVIVGIHTKRRHERNSGAQPPLTAPAADVGTILYEPGASPAAPTRRSSMAMSYHARIYDIIWPRCGSPASFHRSTYRLFKSDALSIYSFTASFPHRNFVTTSAIMSDEFD